MLHELPHPAYISNAFDITGKYNNNMPMLFHIRKLFILCAVLTLAACGAGGFAPPKPVPVSSLLSAGPVDPNNPPLYCRVGRGSAFFDRDWYDFNDTIFALPRGVPANVAITRLRGDGQMTIQALFDSAGQKLIFCPFVTKGAPDERISCSSLYALDNDLKDGIKRTFDIPQAVRGGAITCAYAQDKLRSLDVTTNEN